MQHLTLAELDGDIDALEEADIEERFDELMRAELARSNGRIPRADERELRFSELVLSQAKRDELGW